MACVVARPPFIPSGRLCVIAVCRSAALRTSSTPPRRFTSAAGETRIAAPFRTTDAQPSGPVVSDGEIVDVEGNHFGDASIHLHSYGDDSSVPGPGTPGAFDARHGGGEVFPAGSIGLSATDACEDE